MLVVSPFSESDFPQAIQLHKWISELDRTLNHPLLLLSSPGITDDQMKQVFEIARPVFSKVSTIRQRGHDPKKWPQGPNQMFKTAVEWVKQFNPGPFLWLEPDCVPTQSGWLDKLEHDYKVRGKPFYGTIYDKPVRHFNGVCIYPPNISAYNPSMLGAVETSFDCVRPELTIKYGYNSPLIQRSLADPRTNTPHTFPDKQSLQVIKPGVILFHGCKDQSAFERLLEQRLPNGHSLIKRGLISLFTRKPESHSIIVRRTGAIGDAIAATCVANKLIDQGHKITFECHLTVQQVLKYSPGIQVADVSDKCDVNLDGAYENDKNRNIRHFAEMFIESANRQLGNRITPIRPLNIAPVLQVGDGDWKLLKKHRNHERPWIGIVPRSGSFAVRTVPDETWRIAAQHISGTCFWLGNHGPAPFGIVDLELRDIDKVVKAISWMDLVVSVDSGPCHIATALNIPTLVIEQASSPSLHLSEQRDWDSIYPSNLSCLNCGDHICRFDKDHPFCQDIDPLQISMAVNRKLRQITHNEVGAVVCVYRPSAEMLNKCLSALLPQVSEIVVVKDQAGVFPKSITHPKIRYVTSRLHDSGYGRKLNHGARHTNSKWIAAVTDDVILDPNAITEMLNVGKQSERVGMVGCRLWYPGRKTLQHGGTRRNPGDIGWGHIDHRQSVPTITEPTQTENVTGAAVLMRRKAFYDVQGFDECYYLYFEDSDFSLKLRKNGWEIWYAPQAEGIHDEHSSTRISSEMAACVQDSRKLFTEKWSKYFAFNSENQMGTFDY